MKNQNNSHLGTSNVSIVIPTYNSAPWLPSTLEALEKSLLRTNWTAEIVIVDDGSSDETLEILEFIKLHFSYPVNVISQFNQGRFLARMAGAYAARYPNMMLLDSRILLGENSLQHVEYAGLNPGGQSQRAWNGHSITDPHASLIGHFWEVPTYVFWGRYLSQPQPTVITPENFNAVPKGTTFFICPTELFIKSSEQNWPENNAKLTNDDTKIIRQIVSEAEVVIDPEFWAIYRPRTNIVAFIKHTYARGTTFVDGFAGISLKTNALILTAGFAPVATIILIIGLLTTANFLFLGLFFITALVAVLVPAVIAKINSCPNKGIRSYLTYLFVFAVPYWFGLLRGIKIHGEMLLSTSKSISKLGD